MHLQQAERLARRTGDLEEVLKKGSVGPFVPVARSDGTEKF